jgi:peptidoglycan/LPS O-acetylase OafA/YrhL
MATTSTHLMQPRPAGRRLRIAAVAALVCALAPIVPLASPSHLPWSAPMVDGPYVAVVLAAGVLVAARRHAAGPERRLALTALAVVALWALMLAGLGLALLYGS